MTASEALKEGNRYFPSSLRACVARSASLGDMLWSPLNMDDGGIVKMDSDIFTNGE